MDFSEIRKANARARLEKAAASELEAIVVRYGEVIRPLVETILDEKAEELAARYEQSMMRAFASNADDMPPSHPLLLTRAQVARILGCSTDTVDRLAADGELPRIQLSPGRVAHSWDDVKALAHRIGRTMSRPHTDE